MIEYKAQTLEVYQKPRKERKDKNKAKEKAKTRARLKPKEIDYVRAGLKEPSPSKMYIKGITKEASWQVCNNQTNANLGKVCTKCNEWKPYAKYDLRRAKETNAYHSYCKECRSVMAKKLYLKRGRVPSNWAKRKAQLDQCITANPILKRPKVYPSRTKRRVKYQKPRKRWTGNGAPTQVHKRLRNEELYRQALLGDIQLQIPQPPPVEYEVIQVYAGGGANRQSIRPTTNRIIDNDSR